MSTLTKNEAITLAQGCTAGAEVCETWEEVALAIERFKSGGSEMEHLRDMFTDQYSSWLGDIDNKSRIVVSLAGVLAALSGGLIVQARSFVWTDWIVTLALGTSVLSMLFAIRAFTSRHTSGAKSTEEVVTQLRQAVAILLGSPENWMHRKGDAVEEYRSVRKQSRTKQANAHRAFFYGRYGTHDSQALRNLRFLELRATNYAKLYAERAASKLLMLSILLIVTWTILRAIGVPPTTSVVTPKSPMVPPTSSMVVPMTPTFATPSIVPPVHSLVAPTLPIPATPP